MLAAHIRPTGMGGEGVGTLAVGAFGSSRCGRTTLGETPAERSERFVQIPKAGEHLVRLRRQGLAVALRSSETRFELRERRGDGTEVRRRHRNRTRFIHLAARGDPTSVSSQAI
jgi:hypothetical protein